MRKTVKKSDKLLIKNHYTTDTNNLSHYYPWINNYPLSKICRQLVRDAPLNKIDELRLTTEIFYKNKHFQTVSELIKTGYPKFFRKINSENDGRVIKYPGRRHELIYAQTCSFCNGKIWSNDDNCTFGIKQNVRVDWSCMHNIFNYTDEIIDYIGEKLFDIEKSKILVFNNSIMKNILGVDIILVIHRMYAKIFGKMINTDFLFFEK